MQSREQLNRFVWRLGALLAAAGVRRWFLLAAGVALFGIPSASFAVTAEAVVSSFSARSGVVGAAVIVSGSGFAGATAVSFAGVPAAFVILSDTSIQASVPFGATKGPIRVCIAGGCGQSRRAFRVEPQIDALDPESGPSGTLARILGSALDLTGEVTFNGLSASFTIDSYEQVSATSPQPFTVTGSTLTLKHEGHPGERLKLSGGGFGPLEPLQVLLDHSPFGEGNTDDLGSFELTLTIPSDLAPGEHEIDVLGLVSGNVAFAPFLIVGFWPQFHYDAANSGYQPYETLLSPNTVSNLTTAWSANTGGSVTSSPAVSSGVVYVGSGGGSLYAFKAATGALLWSALTGGPIKSSPALGTGGIVYVGSLDGSVYAFHTANGSQLWSQSTGGIVESSPAVANGGVYVNSGDGNLYAFNAASGKLIWATACNCIGSPAVVNGIVYSNAFEKIKAFNAATGTPLWDTEVFASNSSGPAVAKGIVYIGTTPVFGGSRGLCAFTAIGLTPLWCEEIGFNASSDPTPTVAKGVVSIGSSDAHVRAFNAASGTFLWVSVTVGSISSSSAVANGVLYVGSDDGKLYAMNAASGTVLWTATTGGPIRSSPAVSGGSVYVGSSDGKLYAFRLP
jgi:outer membrane protein assembly factor BamB